MDINNFYLSFNETDILFSALHEYKILLLRCGNRFRAEVVQNLIDKLDSSIL